MPWYYEELGAEAPFDDPDEVIQTRKGATPARNWQHLTARALLARMTQGAELRDAFSLHTWPLKKRVEVVNEVVALIDTFDQDADTVAQQSFAFLRTYHSVNLQFEQMVTEDELEQMMEDFAAVVEQNRKAAKAA